MMHLKNYGALCRARSYSLWPPGLVAVLGLLLSLSSCREGEFREGKFPETRISYEVINLSGDDRLNTTVQLNWYGSDADGYVTGFELSLDKQNWDFTTKQDSLFTFDIPPGQDSADIDFYVRAIDNDGHVDPSPAYLQIPILNSPPEARFLNDRGPGDTAFIAATFSWLARDPDGNESVQQVEIKANQGPWTPIKRGNPLITLVPDTSVNQGPASARLYYGTDLGSWENLSGLEVGDSNRLYIRAVDIAGKTSPVDTSDRFHLRGKTSGVSTLWVSGHSSSITAEYRSLLQNAGLNVELFNLGADQGAGIPKYTDPTIQLIFAQYQRAFLNLSSTSFTNPVTGQSRTLLATLAPVIQRFTDRGGQYFLSTSFPKSADISEITGVYPLQALSLSSQSGSQARITTDSALVPLQSGSFPELRPDNVEFGVVPIQKSSDAQAFYRAELTKFRGWNGPTDVVATVRRPGNQLTEVFFAQELHRYTRNTGAVSQLIGDIFQNEF